MQNQRSKFSIPASVTYLNCAYMSPLMKSVEEAGRKGMKRKQNPFDISAQDFFAEADTLRREFASLIHASDPDRIAIIPSASYGLANAAKNMRLEAQHSIVVVAEQFPSNYYPWQRLAMEAKCKLVTVAPGDDLRTRGKSWNERILNSIDKSTRLIAMGNVHWADGTRFDLEQIRKRADEVGAKLIVDGTQSVGALPFDVQKVKPDALVCSGYKWLLGPYSIGLAYYGQHFDNGLPIEENWINRSDSEDFAGLVNYRETYQRGALRYDVGERSNFIMLPMMITAISQIKRWRPEGIQEYCRSITHKGINTLRNAGYWIEDEKYRGHHLFGIRFTKGASLERVRDHVRKRKIAVSIRGDCMRISPHVYNTASDFEKLVSILLEAKP